MNIRKVFGKTSREALLEVKRLLGSDAAVLSNREVEGGVEMMALAAEDIPPAEPRKWEPPRISTPMPSIIKGEGADTGAESGLTQGRGAAPRRETAAPRAPFPAREPITQTNTYTPPGIQPQLADAMVQTIVSEIASMRSTIEQQLDGLVWSDMQRRHPARTALLRSMLHAGFSPALSRKITDRLPVGSDAQASQQWVQAALARNLPLAGPDEIVAQGGVYALMGPTGVGKTTTTAKLAARCVVRHGAGSLALLTTDTYRIGGQEQLRIYGRILGVPVHAVRDATDLQRTLSELGNKHMVLIDTVGVSQRDQMVAEQVAMLCGCNAKRLLLLNATCGAPTLDDVVQAYQGSDLHGCIVTKLDEAVSIGATLDAIIRHRIPLHYVANGQRVPEDLHTASAEYLVHRAFKMASSAAAHAIEEDELPLVMMHSSAGAGAQGEMHLA